MTKMKLQKSFSQKIPQNLRIIDLLDNQKLEGEFR